MFPALSLCLSRDFFPCPADVAQLVAHPTCNRAVRGSSPLVGSKVQLSELFMSPQRVGRPAGPHFTPTTETRCQRESLVHDCHRRTRCGVSLVPRVTRWGRGPPR